jgi:ferrous iron transport protein B
MPPLDQPSVPSRRDADPLQVALIGNPNTGKSTLFSALVGVHQRVGNYPGVTVEKRTGECDLAGRRFTFIDLPGLYSLSPRSRDELVAVEVLLGRFRDTPPVHAILSIVDASNLERNLYLVSQLLELRLPTIVVLNMLDVAEGHGVTVDPKRLEERLGVPVVPMQANRGVGLAELGEALGRIDRASPPVPPACFPPEFNHEVARLTAVVSEPDASWSKEEPSRPGKRGLLGRHGLRHGWRRRGQAVPRWLTQRMLLDTGGLVAAAVFPQPSPELDAEVKAARARLAQAGCPTPGIETTARYDWVRRVLDGVAIQPAARPTTVSDRVDRVLTHRLWGTIFFGLLVVMLFQAVFVWAEPLVDFIGTGVRGVGSWIAGWMAEGALRSLLVDGVLGGVGTVLAFLPQILVLFLFLAVMEDCGYLARAAYLMDGLMARVGLSGKAFLPLLSSFACAVPGIMATRVIENPHDRLTTILVAPLMTCSARLPIYALLIGAFVPHSTYLGGLLNLQGLTLVALYFLGVIAAVLVAKVLKKTVLRGDAPPFLMELPTYKWPSLRTILLRVAERAWSFVRFAGTMIQAVAIVVWAALYYPHDRHSVEGPFRAKRQVLQSRMDAFAPGDPQREEAAAELAAMERQIAAAYQRQSYLGRFGRAIEPVFRPLGWDWRIGSAVIASLPAREIVVATLGVIFTSGSPAGAEPPEHAPQFHARLRDAAWEGTDRPLFNVPVALSIMVFYALCAQCVATLAVIRQETNSWRWPALAFAYMTALAYCGAFATYRIGMWIGG